MKNFLANKKGLYRITFSVCIFFLSLLTVVITSNYNEKDAQTLSEDRVEESVKFNDEKIEGIVEGLTQSKEVITNTTIMMNDSKDISQTEISFSTPVYGSVIKPFSYDTPLYSKTMDDWRIHNGVDIACILDTEVYSAQDGIVSEIGYDINFGNYVVIVSGDFTCRYTSLSSNIPVSKGENVQKGQLIGTVSDSCISEICDEPHFHFEMMKDSQYINPADYIMFQ